jgi:small subunit ribosomal protein S20
LANHKSAKKRAIQSEKKRIHNMSIKTKLKNAIKAVRTADKDTAASVLDKAKSVIEKSANKGVIHKKNAARKISRLTKAFNALSA